jgi:menaquinone-dependent protoporphyrinogen oxidase
MLMKVADTLFQQQFVAHIPMPTLITYASLRGSTAELAERMSNILKSKGLAVDILPIDQVSVKSLQKYPTVIIGSAVINFEWLPDATSFLRKNSAQLSKVSVWCFSCGCPNTVPKRFEKAWDAENEPALLDAACRREVKNIKEHKLFLGKFLRSHFNFWWNCFWGCCGGKYGDYRDWGEIEGWANKVGDEILKLDGQGA